MITRTTLKTLWLAGGGVLATWIAVSPNHGVPTASPAATTQRSSPAREMSAEDVNSQAARLRARTNATTLRQSTRNPFRFRAPNTAARGGRPAEAPAEPAAIEPSVVAPAPPALTLSGVAEKRTPQGTRRTAVISGEGQLYLVGVGERVAGRYTVVSIDPEAVILRDASGAELRLVFP